jgi:hypothetical protein
MEGHRKRQGGGQGPNRRVEWKWASSELRSVWQRHSVSCSELLQRHELAVEFTRNVCLNVLLLAIQHLDPARLVE